MELMDQVVMQLVQPSFFYAIILSSLALFCSVLLLRINYLIGSRGRSVMFVLPLAVPLLVMLCFPPHAVVLAPAPGDLPGALPFGPLGMMPPMEAVLSVTGLLMIVGLLLCAISLLSSTLLGTGVARRLLKVVDMTPDDFPELQEDVAALASQMGVPAPRIGLTEDLRPNAFTFGQGKGATVVFSLGILDLLDREELRAVAAHELAHIKNADVQFKRNSRALAWLSFFNPAAYLAVRAARREREKYADETARGFLEEQDALLRAIEKVNVLLEGAPHERSLATSVGLGLSLSITERTSLLSDHPSFADRTRSYRGELTRAPWSPTTCVVLSILVVVAMAVVFLSVVEVRAEIVEFSMHGGFGHVPGFHPHVMPANHTLMSAHGFHIATEGKGPPLA